MKEFKRRWLNFLIGCDQFIWVCITLGNSYPDETISAGCWRMEQENKLQGRLFRPCIDWIFDRFGYFNHCQAAYDAEVKGNHTRLIKV